MSLIHDESKAKEIALKAAKILDSKKAKNIKILYVNKQTIIADYFVIAAGTSRTQVNALADEVEYQLGLEGIDPAKSLTVLLNGSKKAIKVDIPQGNYLVLAQNGQADAEGLGAYSGAYISAPATSATILAEQ